MPAPTSLTTWRTHPYKANFYLSIYTPPVIFKALVNQASFTYPIAQLTYDNVTIGAFGDVVVGQTVRILSGNFVKGYGRVRLAPTSNTFYIGHMSEGELIGGFGDNDTIEVLDEFRIWGRIPAIDANNVITYKDYNVEFTDDFGNKPFPVCIAGPHRAGFIDPAIANKLRVAFDLTDSYPVASGATISSFSANLKDGTIVSGSVASGVFTVDFPVGDRLVYFTATDSNAKTHTRRVLVRAHDRTGSTAPFNVSVVRLSSERESGTTMYAQVLEDDLSSVIEGAIVILFAEEWYDNTKVSISGYPGAEQIKFVGYIDTESINISPQVDTFNFTAVGPLTITERITAFSLTLQNKNTSSKWHHMQTLTAFKFIWHLLYWHSTLLDCHDVVEPEWRTDYAVKRLDADFGPLKGQVNFATTGVAASFTCDRQGRFYLRRDLQLASDTNRNLVGDIVELKNTDWSEAVTFDRKTNDQYYWLRGSAIKAGTTPSALLSIAPGFSPSQAGAETTLDRQLVTDQEELNVRAGRQYNLLNTRIPRVNLTIVHGGSVVDPAWQEWVRLDTAAILPNKRNYDFDDIRFVPQTVDLNIDNSNGIIKEHLILEQEAVGSQGITMRVPTGDMVNTALTPLPEFRPITLDAYEPLVIGSPYVLDISESPAVFIATAQYIGRTKDPASTNPTYFKLFDMQAFYGVSGEIRRMILDPWASKYRMYAAGLIVTGSTTSAVVVEIVDIMTSTPTAREIYRGAPNAGNTEDVELRASINVPGMLNGLILPVSDFQLSKTFRRLSYTGAFSTLTSTGTGPPNSAGLIVEHFAGSPSDCNVYAFLDVSGGGLNKIWRSTNGGASFSYLGDSNRVFGGANKTNLLAMYEGGGNGQSFYAWGGGNTTPNIASDARCMRRFDSLTPTNIAPSDGMGGFHTTDANANWQTTWSFHVYTLDHNIIAFVGGSTMYKSLNGGSSWSTKTLPVGSNVFAIGGWPNNSDIFLVYGRNLTSGIYYTNNDASSWRNIIGTWATDIATFTGAVSVIPITVI